MGVSRVWGAARPLELVSPLSMRRCSRRLEPLLLLHTPHHRVGEAAGGCSAHSTLPRQSHPRFLCSGRGNRTAAIAALFLANLHFSFLVSQYRSCLIPVAHSVTCWRADIVSSRSAASSLTVKSISNFFFGQFYAWLSFCAIYLGGNNVILWQNYRRLMYLKHSFQVMGDL